MTENQTHVDRDPRRKTGDEACVSRFSRHTRLLIGGGGLGLLCLLLLAAVLRPADNGLGTHQQLGLPPCSARVIFGVRCPTCGMTTAWANVMHGRIGDALRANVAGTALVLAAWLAGPWLLISAWRGRWLLGAPSERSTAALMIGVLVWMLVEWGIRVAFFN